MGDTQAVELAQTCHLGLALQHSVLAPGDLVGLTLPPPRGKTFAGILINDFVTLSKRRPEQDGASPAAVMADKMQDTYKAVELLPNERKAFRDQEVASFLGLRPGWQSWTFARVFEETLAGLLLEVVQIGVATPELLQVLTGSVISLFFFRRRRDAAHRFCAATYVRFKLAGTGEQSTCCVGRFKLGRSWSGQ